MNTGRGHILAGFLVLILGGGAAFYVGAKQIKPPLPAALRGLRSSAAITNPIVLKVETWPSAAAASAATNPVPTKLLEYNYTTNGLFDFVVYASPDCKTWAFVTNTHNRAVRVPAVGAARFWCVVALDIRTGKASVYPKFR